ncbi:hypothetical protein Tco_0934516 [Tanacetum coccineum]
MKKIKKKFDIAHAAECEKFMVLRKALTKVLQSEWGKSVTEKVQAKMEAVIINEAAEGEKTEKNDNANPDPTQGEYQANKDTLSPKASAESQVEPPPVSKIFIEEPTPLNSIAMGNEEKALILCHSKEKKEDEIINAKKVGLPPLQELATFGKTSEDNKRKRSKMIKHMFVKEDVEVDGTQRNVAPPAGVIGKIKHVIRKLEAGFFYLNGNCDLVFQRESEFHITSIIQLIRLQRLIIQDSPKAREMINTTEYEIESRNDVTRAREIVEKNLDKPLSSGLRGDEVQLSEKHQLAVKGLSECKASKSNVRRIQVKDTVKEVEDYLKV